MQQDPSLERRTLLAFVLMFAIIFGWSTFFGPKPVDKPAEDVPETTALETPNEEPRDIPPAPVGSPVEETTTSSVADPGPGAWIPSGGGELGQTVRVETDHFVALIDLVGADIVSWRLKNYRTVEGDQVELVPSRTLDSGTQRAHVLRLVYAGQFVDLRDAQFESDRLDLTLNAERPEGQVVLRAEQANGGRLELTLRFTNDRYDFDAQARYLPAGGVLQDPMALELAWPGGVASSEPDTTREYQEFKAVARVGADIHKKKFGDLEKDGGAKGRAVHQGTVNWAGAVSQYFTALVLAPKPGTGEVRFDGDHARRLQTFSLRLPMEGLERPSLDYTVYLGPLDLDAMKRFDADPYNAELTRLIDLGPSIFRPVAKLTLNALKVMYSVIPNYGLVIILFSTLTKVLFYPLTKSQTMSMRKMQEIQPKLQKLKEKYKDDQQRQSQEMFKLYKEHGVNPMGGCLPLLVQMPVFWALFTVLRKTIEMRQAGFMGWITDLSRPDVLFELPFSLPILGNNFCVLPFLMAIGMWGQSKLSSPGGGGGEGAMAAQMRMMTTFMPIMMFVFFYNSPSGLVLYWFVNTLLTIVQTWRIHQKMKPAEADVTPA